MWNDMNSTPLVNQTGTSGVMNFISYNPNNSLNIAFKNALPNNRFVLGVRWNYEAADRQWSISNPSVTIKIHFTPPQQSVFVDQLLSDGSTRIGKIKLWGGTSFSNPPLDPGQSFNFYINSHQIIQGDQTEYSNQKYNKWNSENDVKNQHDFLIGTGTNNLTSNFQPNYYNAKVRNAIEGLSNKDGGILYFKDPWLIDSIDQSHANTYMNRGNDAIYNNINSPLNFSNGSFSNYKGIFLNQDYDPQVGKPCYSVKTPEVQNINLGSPQGTHKFYFQNYSSTGTGALTQNNYVNGTYETPIVFTSGDAIVNANLKGVQLSSTSSAFESNSQRKIVRSVYDAALYQVYESMGNIYLEKSTDNGQTWDIINRINTGKYLNNYPAHSPSIDYLPGDETDFLFITFEENESVKIVCMATKINLQFSAVVSYLNYPNNGSNPVVSCFGPNKIMVVWKDADLDYNDGLVCRHGTVNTNGLGSYTWSEELDDNTFISYSNQYSQNPSIDIYKDGTSQIYRLAWDDYENVYSCDLKINSNNTVYDSNLVVVSDYTGFTNNFKPSITAVNGGARMTWIGYRVNYIWNGRMWLDSEEQDAAFMDPEQFKSVMGFWQCCSKRKH